MIAASVALDPRPVRKRPSPRNSKIGAAMNTDELAQITIPNSIGIGKLDTELPPASAIGSIARKAVPDGAGEVARRHRGVCCTSGVSRPRAREGIKTSIDARPLVDRKARLEALLVGAPESLRYNDHQIGQGPAFHRLAASAASKASSRSASIVGMSPIGARG